MLVRLLILLTVVLQCAAQPAQPTATCRFLRSSSGPAGRVAGARYVLDETRSRFVYPADRTVVVYFEWQARPGRQVLSGIWKHPDGKGRVLSDDIRLDTAAPEFGAYWTLNLSENLEAGVWELEVRVNGQPCGSHFFELAMPAKPEAAAAPSAPPEPAAPTPGRPAKSLDETYRSVASVVWVHKRDATGRRFDTTSGFVIAPGRVLTAFQSVDSAASVEVEFHDRQKVTIESLAAWDRNRDWAILATDTGTRAPLALGNAEEVPVGERVVVFNVEAGLSRAIGGVDLTGRGDHDEFGPRMSFSPAPAPEATGGPVLNLFGEVVGLLGGSLTPGSRTRGMPGGTSAGLWYRLSRNNLALPIQAVRLPGADTQPTTFAQLRERGILTPPLGFSENLLYGGTTNFIPKYDRGIPNLTTVAEFSRSEPELIVYTVWERKDKKADPLLSYRIFDLLNRERVTSPPKKIAWLPNVPVLSTVKFAPGALTPGIYRADVLLGDQTVFRTYFRVLD